MRKSFTRFLSVLMLFCAFGLQVFAADGHWLGDKSKPIDEYPNVAPADIATQFVLAFDAAPTFTGSGTLVVYEADGTTIKKLVTLSSANTTVVDKTLVVKHGITSFAEEHSYSIVLLPGAVKVVTEDGTDLVSIPANTYHFTVGDFTAPKLATTNPLVPAAGATKVAANLLGADFTLTMKFNETVLKGKGNIAIYQENGTVVELIDVATAPAGVIDIAGSTVTITVADAAHFLPETKYYVRVAAGAFTDDVTAYGEDAEANAYAGIAGNTAWTFTTRDNTAPAVTATVTNVTATTAKLNVTLSEAGSFKYFVGQADPTDGSTWTNVASVAANTAKVISLAGLQGGKDYAAYVIATNNEVPANTTETETAIDNKVEFTTVDNIGPVAEARGQIITDKKTTGVYIYFDEQVKGGTTGSLVVRKKSNNAAVFTLAPSAVSSVLIDDEDSEFDGKWKATINFGGALASNEEYYIVFPEGYITDMLGNKYVSSNNEITVPVNYTGGDAWLIWSSDFEAPVVTFQAGTQTPTTSNITGAANTDNIKIIFDEAVELADGEDWPSASDFANWSKYVALQKDGITVPADYLYAMVVAGNDTTGVITIDPSSALESNTVYTVILRPAAIMDASPNENVLAAAKSITVATGDNDARTFTFNPTSEGDGFVLGANTPMTITFSKDVFVKSGSTKTALASSALPALIAVDKAGTPVADGNFTMAYDATNKTVSVTPVAGKEYASSVCSDGAPVVYHLVLTTTNLVDSKSGAFTGVTGATQTYTVEDYKAPVATVNNAAVEISDITDDNISISFDEPVNILTAYSTETLTTETLADQIIFKKDGPNGVNLPFIATTSATTTGVDIIIAPTGGWKVGTYYYGIGSSMQDCAGNVNVANYKSFTVTADAVPTTLKALSYTVNGGSSIAIGDVAQNVKEKTAGGLTFVVTFDQAIDDKDLAIVDQVTSTLSINPDPTVSSNVNGNKLTINVPTSVVLASATEYAITIPSGLVEGNATYDNDGLLYAQLPVGGITFHIKSADTVSPTVVESTPTASATGVALDLGEDGLTLTFSEKVVLGTGSITIAATGNTQTITVNATNVALDNSEEDYTVATIAAADLTKYNTVYTVTVPATAFKDLAGNTLSATSNSTFTFTTEVNPQPEIAEDGLYPANGADNVARTLDLTMNFTEDVLQASTTGSRKLVYVFKVVDADGTRASINTSTGDVDPGDDTQVYYAYVDIAANVGVSGSLVTIKGVQLAADSEYYVLVTPGAFKDKSAGVGTTANPVPGIYAGITNYDVEAGWHFYTGDVIPAEADLAFSKLGADELVATDSDIKLVFTKAVQKYVNGGDPVAISNEEIPNLVTLEKYVDGEWVNIEFTGTISTDKKTITIDNSSLVRLEEMKGSTEYKVSFAESVFVGTDGTPLDAWEKTFVTSDYDAPAAPVVAYKVDEATSVFYDTEDDANVHTAELTLADDSDGDAVKMYYLWTADLEAEFTAALVKGLGVAVETNTTTDLVFNKNMANETDYRVLAVAEDAAGNLSEVTDFTYTTDDVVAPELAESLPTSLGIDNVFNLVFNEDVVPASSEAYARIIDANGVTYKAPLQQLAGTETATNIITIQINAAGLPISNDVATYTVEVDPEMIVDVPREIEEGVYANEPNAFAGILGTSFKVTSDDNVAPELVSTDPESEAIVGLTPSFKLNFSEAVNVNDEFTQFVIYEVNEEPSSVALKGASIPATPYDVLTIDNVSGQGTSEITLTTNRALVSGHSYRLEVIDGTFSDLNDNEWANGSNVNILFTASDVVGLPVTFRLPQDGEPFYLPVDEDLTEVPENVCIVFAENNGLSGFDGDAFNYEPYRINPEDQFVNSYELASHLYLKVDGVDVPFTFTTSWGNDRINLFADFADYKGKTITYGFTNLYDAEGNLNAGAEVSFTIAPDAVEKRLVTFTPGDNDDDSETEVNIAVDQTFKVEFDGIIYSYSTTESENNLIMSASLLESLGVFTMNGAELEVVNYSEAGGKSVVTLKATEDLTSESVYTLTLNQNLIQIGQGNEKVLGEYTETFMTADVVAPKLMADGDGETLPSSYKPNNGGTVAKDQTLALAFDEPVIGAGTVEIHRWDGVLVASVDITGVESDEDDVIAIADLAEVMASNPNFVTNTKYYVVVPSGAITDLATTPNAYAGITKVNEWTFDLRDDASPAVTFVQNMKSGVAVDAKLQLLFDRPVDALTGANAYGWLAVYEQTDGDAVKLIRIPPGATASDVTSYSFDPMNFAPDTKYYVELGEGTFVLSADGTTPQKQVNIGEWWFSTEVNAKPVAVDFVPEKADPMATGVALNSDLSITFDQPVVAGTGNIQLHRKQNVGGPIITNFNVADPTQVTFVDNKLTIAAGTLKLQNNSEYYVIIPGTAVKNTSSSPEFWDGIVVPFEWQFTTINDQTAPTAVYSPITTGLKPADIKLTMTFNEPVVAGTGDVVIYKAADNSVAETVAFAPSMLVNNVITVTPTTIVEGVAYYVNVTAGIVKDAAGNSFAGVTNKTDWAFSTGDFTAPKFMAGTPTGTMAEGNHPTFVMTFDENVVLGTGNLKVIKKDGTTPVLTIPVTSAVVSGKTVTVTYVYDVATGGLDKNTDYYVLLDGGIVKDATGNASVAVTDVAAWTFKTGANFTTDTDPVIDNSLEFKVYPNPFVDYVIVDNASELTKVVVTNIAGQVVKEVVAPDSRIQLNELRSGVYFISLYKGNTVAKTVKIAKR